MPISSPRLPPPKLHVVLARRAIDVARDPATSEHDAAAHLTRLAAGHELPLRLALAHLRRADTGSSRVEQACRLLTLAIEDARAHAA
jgi:hypothetical protein